MIETIINKDNFLENKKYITYSVYFGGKDRDLWLWAESIPNGRFAMVIKDTVRAYQKKDVNYIIPKFENNSIVHSPLRRNFAIGKDDYDIYQYFNKIGKKLISHEIKEIIRYYLYHKSGFTKGINENSYNPLINNRVIIPNVEENAKFNGLNSSTAILSNNKSSQNEMLEKIVNMKNRNVRNK